MGRGRLDANEREYEITKHVSLALVDPEALLRLKATGDCFVDLPEALFDLDYPGHYMRRLKSVGITIPAVTGPHTAVDCTLTLLRNSIRDSSDPGAQYERSGSGDERFHEDFTAIQSIVTSSAHNDSGLFGSKLRDEHLPFEGAGAISRWRIELPLELKAFDLDSISDVVLQLRYTARDGGAALRTAALDSLVAGTARSRTKRRGARPRARDHGDD